MAKQSALEKLIAAIPEHFLDQPCSDEHLREIGICITNWQIIAPHLNLSPADEEIIATFPGDKRIRMLRRWRQKRGSSATYRGLAASFQKVERADLIDKIRTLLPEWHLPSPGSRLSPNGAQEQNSARISPPLASPSSNSTQLPITPHPTSQPIPIEHRVTETHYHDPILSTSPESHMHPTSNRGEDPHSLFGDLASPVDTSTEQKRSLSTEEGAYGLSVSPQQATREEYFSKLGIESSGTYEDWCCHLKYVTGSQVVTRTASGVLVNLNYTPEELHAHLPGLKPMKKYPEYGSVQTSYILITCHHTIPGMSYLKGWSLSVGLGKAKSKSPLKSLVCGAVSCCGENGLISSGPFKPQKEKAVFSPHLNSCCSLDLDFIILFLNSAFEKLVSNRKGVQTRLPKIILNLLTAENHRQLQLYQRERHGVVPIPLSVEGQPQDSSPSTLKGEIEAEKYRQLQLYQRERRHGVVPISPNGVEPQDSSPSTLKGEIESHKTLQVIHYTRSKGPLTQCCSGSPLVSCDPDSDTTLVGIHTKASSDFRGSGITVYGIFELLKGQPAAVFAVMEQPLARKKWPFRWSHLLIHALESDAVGEKEKPLSYLLEILHLLLLTDICGIRLIELQISDTSLKHTSALELLSALFKRFDKYGCEEIAEAVSETFTDELRVNEFNKELQQISSFLVKLLNFLLRASAVIKNEVDLVKAYFECYNWVLNFEYKGKFEPVLSMPDVTAKLKRLRKECSEKLPLDKDYVIGRNFFDIWLQLMTCKHESQIHQLEAQNKELMAQNQQLKEQLQKQQDESATCMQQTERKLREQKIEYERKIQRLKEQLQKQQDER